MITNSNDYPLDDNDYDESKDDFPIAHNLVPDDEQYFCRLLKDEWSLTGPADADRNPQIIYDTSLNSTRQSNPGSILIYETSNMFPQITGINYESMKHTKGMTIDIQCMVRDRGYAWAREVLRILSKNRRKGIRTLNGWDFMTIKTASKRGNYIGGYFQFVIEFDLTRYIQDLQYDGFGGEQ